VLRYDGNSKVLQFYPSQPTSVEATIVGSTGPVKVSYNVEGTYADSLPAKKWKMVSSTIGDAECHDFEDNEVAFVNETISGTTHNLRWNGIRSGTIGLTTTYFTPKILSDPLRITPTLGALTFNSLESLTNSDSIMLQNYDQQGITNYATIKGIFEMISEEKLCMSKYAENKIEIFWNPEYINSLTESVQTGSGSGC
jgi:hypothetical protein